MLLAAFAKEQPVIRTPQTLALPQQAAQAGQPGTGADEDARAVILRQMETGVRPQLYFHHGTRFCMTAQPAGTLSCGAVVIEDLTDVQLQSAVLRQAGDGIGAQDRPDAYLSQIAGPPAR